MLSANNRKIVLGKNSPNTKTTKVVMMVFNNNWIGSLGIKGVIIGVSNLVIKKVKTTKAILLPTNIVPKKRAGSSKKFANIFPLLDPLFRFSSTLSLLEDIKAISDPENKADKAKKNIINNIKEIVMLNFSELINYYNE